MKPKIKNRIYAVVWLLTFLVILNASVQYYCYTKINQLVKDEQVTDSLEAAVARFMIMNESLGNSKGDDSLSHLWESTLNEIYSIVKKYPKLNRELETDFNELENAKEKYDKTVDKSRDEFLAKEADKFKALISAASFRIFSKTQTISQNLSGSLQRKILWIGLSKDILLLISSIVGAFLLYSVFSKISTSLNSITADIKGAVPLNYHTINTKRPYQEIEDIAIGFNKLMLQKNELIQKVEDGSKLLEGIFQNVNIGLCQIDPEGRIVTINISFSAILGYEVDALIGQSIANSFPEVIRNKVNSSFQRKTGDETDKPVAPDQVSFTNDNGETYDVLISISTVENGGITYLLVSLLDVTLQMENQNMLLAAVEGGRIGTWFLNLTTRSLSVNHIWATMFGYTLEEVGLKQDFFFDIVHPEDQHFIHEVFEEIKDPSFNLFDNTIRLRCKDGTYKHVKASGSVLRRDEDKRPIAISGVHIDLTKEFLLQKQLKKDRKRLQESQKLGKLGDWTYDSRADEMTWSDQVREIFEWDRDKPLPDFEKLLTFFNKPDAEELRQAILSQREYVFYHSITVNQKIKHLKSIGKALFDDSGLFKSFKGVVQDITDITNVQRQKEQQEQRLSALANNLPGAVFQYKLNKDGSDQMLYLSKGVKNLWGYTPEEIINNNMLVWSQIHQDDITKVRQSIEESANNMSLWRAEWRNINADNSISWHEGSGIPRRGEDCIIWDSFILDVTEKKEFKVSLNLREAYLAALYKHAFDGILSCDAEGKNLYFNDKLIEWVGTIPDELEPKDYPVTFGLYTFDLNRHLQPEELSLNAALKTGKIQFNRFAIINDLNPNPRFVEANGSRITSSTGEILGASVIVRDITDIVESDATLSGAVMDAREEERLKIASELHDNITQTLGMSKMNLGNLALDEPEIKNNLRYQKAITMLTNAIEDTRNLSHTIMPTSIQDFGLVNSIQEILEDLKERSKINYHYSNNIDRRIDKSLELELYRIAQEAISNVETHSKASELWVTLNFLDRNVKLTIEDNGIGFESKYVGSQTGIGLITMKKRVERKNGVFRVISGESGTEINIQIPLKTNYE